MTAFTECVASREFIEQALERAAAVALEEKRPNPIVLSPLENPFAVADPVGTVETPFRAVRSSQTE